MDIFINYFNFIGTKIVDILDSLKMPNGQSILFYVLGTIILGFVIKLVKGSASEFESGFNSSNSSIIKSASTRYQENKKRKADLVNKQKRQDNIVYEYMDDNF